MSQTSSLLSRITIEDGKCGGRPCIRGQRMRVADILELPSAGADVNEILEDYPSLERDDVLAAIEFAARQTDHPIVQSHEIAHRQSTTAGARKPSGWKGTNVP